jgi:hypothetical protein
MKQDRHRAIQFKTLTGSVPLVQQRGKIEMRNVYRSSFLTCPEATTNQLPELVTVSLTLVELFASSIRVKVSYLEQNSTGTIDPVEKVKEFVALMVVLAPNALQYSIQRCQTRGEAARRLLLDISALCIVWHLAVHPFFHDGALFGVVLL